MSSQETTPAASSAADANSAMPEPKIKHDFYQTETTVVVEVRLKGCQADDVKVTFTEKTLSLTAKIPGKESEYSLELDLAHPVLPQHCSYKVHPSKIEVKITKAEGIRWAALEGDGSCPIAPAKLGGAGAAAKKEVDPKKYPSSSGKDWNRIGVEIEKNLEEDKLEGEAALNDMFQKIYADGNDEVRKAMNKSMSESGGTVLSTNWGDIKKDKVEVKAPEGMEFKKWDS